MNGEFGKTFFILFRLKYIQVHNIIVFFSPNKSGNRIL